MLVRGNDLERQQSHAHQCVVLGDNRGRGEAQSAFRFGIAGWAGDVNARVIYPATHFSRAL
jgi:hypothetical protein